MDEFSITRPDEQASAHDGPLSSTVSVDQHITGPSTDELQEHLASLIRDLGEDIGVQSLTEDASKDLKSSAPIKVGDTSTRLENTAPAFRDSVQKTLERIRTTSNQIRTSSLENEPDDLLEQLLKEMQDGESPGERSADDLDKALLGMMEQLTNKEILYEPMKEMHDKFPDWLARNRHTLPIEDLKRYNLQQALVGDIVARFQQKDYSDSSPVDRDFIIDRMQKVGFQDTRCSIDFDDMQMQVAGSPPADLVGDIGVSLYSTLS